MAVVSVGDATSAGVGAGESATVAVETGVPAVGLFSEVPEELHAAIASTSNATATAPLPAFLLRPIVSPEFDSNVPGVPFAARKPGQRTLPLRLSCISWRVTETRARQLARTAQRSRRI